MAGHMALMGYDVSLWNRTTSSLDGIIENDSTITLSGCVEGKARVSLVTDDIQEAVAGRDIIVVTVPAHRHSSVVQRMLPFLDGHMHIVLHPGHTFGALEVRKILVDHDASLESISVSEIQSSLFTTRWSEPPSCTTWMAYLPQLATSWRRWTENDRR